MGAGRRAGVGWLAVVTAGGVETAMRSVPASAVRLVSTELGAVAASVSINLVVRQAHVLTVTQTAFLACVFAAFAPTVLPGEAGVRARREPTYRAVIAVGSAVYALPFVMVVTGSWRTLGGTGETFRRYLFLATVLVVLATGLYLRAAQSEPLISPDAPATVIVRSRPDADPAEASAEFAALADWPPVARTAVAGLAGVGVAASHVVPMVLFGLLGAALNAVFPVLELLVLLGVIGERTETGRELFGRLPDVEAEFYDDLTAATRGPAGAATALAVVSGVVVPVGAFVLAAATGLFDLGSVRLAWTTAADLAWRAATGTVRLDTAWAYAVRAVAQTGSFLAVPTAVAYTVWYWSREARRLTTTLEADAGRVPARPPGLLLPAVLLVAAWDLEFGVRSVTVVDPVVLLAVAAPVCLVAMAWTVRETWRHDRFGLRVSGANWPVFPALAGSVFVGWVILNPVRSAARAAVLGSVAVGWLYGYESVRRWVDARDSRGPVFLVVYGTLPSAVTVPLVAVGRLPPFLLGLLVIPLLVVVERWLADRLPDGDDPS